MPKAVKEANSTAFPTPAKYLPFMPAEPLMVRYDSRLYIHLVFPKYKATAVTIILIGFFYIHIQTSVS